MSRAVAAFALGWVLIAPCAAAAGSGNPAGALLFTTDREGLPPRAYVANADGTTLKRISVGAAEAEWAPNGGRIVVYRAAGERSQLWTHDPTTGAERLLVEEAFDPSISPDGSTVVYESSEEEVLGIVDVETGERRVLVPRLGFAYVGAPQWAPAGDLIAFEYDFEEIWVVRPDGSGLRRLRAGSGPAWAPDGRLAFSAGRDADLFVSNGDGTAARRLTHFGTYVHSIEWSPDGSRLAFAAGARNHDLEDAYVINADGTGLVRIARRMAQTPGRALSWSPDGAWIGVALHRHGVDDVWLVRPDGTELRRVTHGARYGGDSVEPHWDPRARDVGAFAGVELSHEIPTETRNLGALVETAGPIQRLVADDHRAAYVVGRSAFQCARPELTDFRTLRTTAFWCAGVWPGGSFADLTLRGRSVSWLTPLMGRYGETWNALRTATARQPRPRGIDLSSFSRIAAGDAAVLLSDRRCCRRGRDESVIARWDGRRQTILRRTQELLTVLDAASRKALVHEGRRLRVYGMRGRLLASIKIRGCAPPSDAGAALTGRARARCQLDGAAITDNRVLVLHDGTLDIHSATTGRCVNRRTRLPRNARLVDADGGLAVFVAGRSVIVTRLADGRRWTLRPPGDGAVLADIERVGLYYAYSVAATPRGRVRFMSARELRGKLHATEPVRTPGLRKAR